MLDTAVTPELAAEGTARDVVRVVQQARRDAGLDVSDRIALTLDGPGAVLDAVRAHEAFVAGEVLARAVGYGPVPDTAATGAVAGPDGAAPRSGSWSSAPPTVPDPEPGGTGPAAARWAELQSGPGHPAGDPGPGARPTRGTTRPPTSPPPPSRPTRRPGAPRSPCSVRGGTVLDVGCGGGAAAFALVPTGRSA